MVDLAYFSTSPVPQDFDSWCTVIPPTETERELITTMGLNPDDCMVRHQNGLHWLVSRRRVDLACAVLNLLTGV